MKEVVRLEKARETALFGSKAVGLGQAMRDGLPVPPGVALSGSVVEAVAAGKDRVIKHVEKAAQPLGGPLAVRSSAAAFEPDAPKPLFRTEADRGPGPQFIVSPDGQRFLINSEVPTGEPATLAVIVNWQSLVSRR